MQLKLFLRISLGFSVAYIQTKRVVIFHIFNCDSDSIYNCVHLYVLPFIRFSTGRKQRISSIKTKVIIISFKFILILIAILSTNIFDFSVLSQMIY